MKQSKVERIDYDLILPMQMTLQFSWIPQNNQLADILLPDILAF